MGPTLGRRIPTVCMISRPKDEEVWVHGALEPRKQKTSKFMLFAIFFIMFSALDQLILFSIQSTFIYFCYLTFSHFIAY